DAPAANQPEGSFSHELSGLVLIAWLLMVFIPARGFCFPPAALHRAAEPIGLFAGVDDMSAIRNPVHHRLAQSSIGKHLRPFGKPKVARNHKSRPFSSFGYHLVEKLGPDIGKRDIANFVDRNQLVAKPTGQKATHTIVLSGFDKLVDQASGRCESDTSPLS